MHVSNTPVNVAVRAPAMVGTILRRLAWENGRTPSHVLHRALLFTQTAWEQMDAGNHVVVTDDGGRRLGNLDARLRFVPERLPARPLPLELSSKTHALLIALMEWRQEEMGVLAWRAAYLIDHVLREMRQGHQVLLLNRWSGVEGWMHPCLH